MDLVSKLGPFVDGARLTDLWGPLQQCPADKKQQVINLAFQFSSRSSSAPVHHENSVRFQRFLRIPVRHQHRWTLSLWPDTFKIWPFHLTWLGARIADCFSQIGEAAITHTSPRGGHVSFSFLEFTSCFRLVLERQFSEIVRAN